MCVGQHRIFKLICDCTAPLICLFSLNYTSVLPFVYCSNKLIKPDLYYIEFYIWHLLCFIEFIIDSNVDFSDYSPIPLWIWQISLLWQYNCFSNHIFWIILHDYYSVEWVTSDHCSSERRYSWKLNSGAWSWLRNGLSQGSALHFQHLSQRPWSPLCSLERIVTQPNMSIQNLAQNIYVFILWFEYFCTLDWNKLKIIKVINDDNQHIGAWSMIKTIILVSGSEVT